MKICLVYDFLSEHGGIERLLLIHAQMLQSKGHEVEILTCYYDPQVLKGMNFKNVKVRNISSIAKKYELPAILFSLLGFNKLKSINPDLFISYSFPSNYMLRNKKVKKINFMNHTPRFLYYEGKQKVEWAASTQGIKRWIVLTLSFIIGGWLKMIDKRLVKNNDFLFSNSVFTKKKLDKIYGVNTKVSYPPVDPIFKPSKSRIKRKFIFASGRIIPEKKYDWLVEACGKMKTKVPLLISGQATDAYKNKLEKLAKDNKVNLKFLGKLSTEELVKYYSSAAVFGFTIPLCDYGLVPIESMSCGTPVVAWGDNGGQTELIKEGISGFFAKPYDLDDFARCMEKAIKSNMKIKKKKQMSEWIKKFSYDYIKDEFVRDVEKAAEKV